MYCMAKKLFSLREFEWNAISAVRVARTYPTKLSQMGSQTVAHPENWSKLK
jgi:hypothetical protein